MNDSIPIAISPPSSETDDLRTLVELDRRRGNVGIHAASDPTRPARSSTTLWLSPEHAERLAQEILSSVAQWRDDQSATAWASTHHAGGRA